MMPPPSERQARLIWFAVSGLAIAVVVALAVGLIWGLGRVLQLLSPVLWPLAVAGVVAYLLDPVVDLLEKRGMRRPPAILLVFVLALLVVGGIVGSIVPQVVTETRDLVARFPSYAHNTATRIEKYLNNPPPLVRRLLERAGAVTPPPPAGGPETTNAPPVILTNAPAIVPNGTNTVTTPPALKDETLHNAAETLARALPHIGTWLFGQVGRVASWFGVLAGLALVPVYTFYFLLEKQGISNRWSDYLPLSDSRFKNELVFVLNAINGYLISFFRGQVLVAMCDGFLYGFGFLIIGLPYAVLIGVVAVFLTMIPFVGAIVTCCAALLIALVQFGDWLHPLLVLLVFGCVQALEGLLISPRIMGGRVGLHPVTIIIAVMAGTTLLGGLLGGILAIPFTAALRVVLLRYVWKRETNLPGLAANLPPKPD